MSRFLAFVIACIISLPTLAIGDDLVKSTSTLMTFLMFSSTDHLTGKTGATVTCKLSKNGGTGATTTNSISEIDATNHPGRYKVTLTTTETDTAGPLDLTCIATGADVMDYHARVYDPATASFGVNLVNILGTAVATPATAGTLDINVKNWNNSAVGALQAFPPNFAVAVFDASGRMDLSKVNGSAINNLISGRVDVNAGVVGDKTGYTLTGAEHTQIGADVGSRVVESVGTFTYDQVMRIMFSILAGRTAGGGTVFRTPDNSTVRGTFTLDGSNNRTGVTLTP